MSEDDKKRPRGIRFTNSGYGKLQKACEASEHSHLDEFILALLNTKNTNTKIDAAVRKVREGQGVLKDLVLEGVNTLLGKYTS